MKKTSTAKKSAAPTALAPKPSKPEPKVEGISKRDLPPIRKKLLEMREQLLKAVNDKQQRDIEVGQDVGDEADQATSSQEKEMLFELSDNERVMLDQIEGSLRKMEKGAYGLCESCQKPIAKARIQAVPFARYCIQCQSSQERAPV
ncbi:MAG: TraR/DksA family transcriptional regulator [Elusimicrobia bacterium]|nr:TraR/DksA family transcriptional regulator [Elusimicrobiota bacterium]